MERADLIFSCGPPLLAMILQRWGTPSEATLESEAEDAKAAMGLPNEGKERIQHSLSGAVAVANLTTTFVSSASGVFALLHTAHASAVFNYVALAVAVVVFIMLSNILNNAAFYEIVQKPIPAPAGFPTNRFLLFTRTISSTHRST
ncbi:hypothetical protein ACQR0V_12970 [Bradyrhizobium sp. HKCCYLS2058]|uniref:hypothetical protein n=1 Tax=unclassified Bradyrhizobium TaxID=2631580 RepID=UPI003EBA4CC6